MSQASMKNAGFRFERVDEKSFNHFRGAKALAQIFSDEPRNCDVRQVISNPGHIAVLFNNSTAFVVFDSVPYKYLISESQQLLLYQDISNSSEEKYVDPDVLISRHQSKIINLQFIHSTVNSQQLVAVEESGQVTVWQWTDEEWMWRNMGSIALPSEGILQPPVFSQAHVVRGLKNNFLYWTNIEKSPFADAADQTSVFMSKLIVNESPAQITNATSSPSKIEKNNVSVENAQMIEVLDSIDHVSQGPYGLWIISKNSILFHSTIQEVSISMTRPAEFPFITQHLSSRELILMNNSGDIYSCYPHHNEQALVFQKISSINPWLFSEENPVVDIVPYAHVILVATRRDAFIYHIKSGLLVAKVDLPRATDFVSATSPLHSSEHAIQAWSRFPIEMNSDTQEETSIGLWGNGVWILHSPNIQTQLHAMKGHLNKSNEDLIGFQKAAIELCKEWGLDRQKAKYLLDLIFTSHKMEMDNQTILAACKEMHSQLQNPSLLLALFASPTQFEFTQKFNRRFIHSYLEGELKQFLDVFDHGGENTGRKSFFQYTTLNVTLVPIFRAYLDVGHAENNIKKKKFNLEDQLHATQPSQLNAIDPSTLEVFVQQCPLLLMEKIEALVGIDHRLLEDCKLIIEHFNNNNGNNDGQYNTSGIFSKYNQLDTKLRTYFSMPLCTVPQFGYLAPLPQQDFPTLSNNQYQHAYFEILCKLYHYHNPQLLVPFVDLIYNASVDHLRSHQAVPSNPIPYSRRRGSIPAAQLKERYYYWRACEALPQVLAGQQGTLSKDDIARIEALVVLASRSGDPVKSMRLILSLGDEFWPAAIDLMKIHQSQSIEHLELFQLLLSHCFGDLEQYRSRLESLWEFFPEKFTALDLIGIFKAETEKIKARQITQIAEQLNTDEARTYNSLVINNLNSYMTQEKKMKMTLRTHTGLNVGDVKNELLKAFERENNALTE